MVNCKVSEHLTVNLNTSLVEQAHQLAIAETLHAGSSIDTLNPQGAEIALLGATVAECVCETFLPSVLGNGPHVLAGTEVTSGQTQIGRASCRERVCTCV